MSKYHLILKQNRLNLGKYRNSGELATSNAQERPIECP